MRRLNLRTTRAGTLDMREELHEEIKLKGVYTITKAFLETRTQFALDALIRSERALGHDVIHLIRQLNEMCRIEKIVVENLMPTVGRTAIAANLSNASPSPSSILSNYFALGTGTTAPANADTTLETEVFRNLVASRTNSANKAYITGFFTSTETTGTYKEVGLFINGTATSGTGTLLSRVAVDITKTSLQTLTIDYTITVN